MNNKVRLSFKVAVAIFFAINLVGANVGSVRADTVLDCTEEGKPYLELHGWLTNETVKVIVNGEVIGEFTTDDDGFGKFILDQPGNYDVSVQNSGDGKPIQLGSITCEPLSPPLSYIVITPPSATLNPGDTQQFSAKGYGADGSEVPIDPTWTTTGGGEITPGGKYTAPEKPEEDNVIVEEGGVSASAQVRVYVPLSYIVITPPSATLNPGDTQQFSAKGYGADGSEVPIDPTWTTTSGSKITSDGKYTAPKKPGEYTVIAQAQNITETAAVKVNPVEMATEWIWVIGIVSLVGLGFVSWYFLRKYQKVAG